MNAPLSTSNLAPLVLSCPLGCVDQQPVKLGRFDYKVQNNSKSVDLCRCPKCTVEFLAPVPSDEDMIFIYEEIYSAQDAEQYKKMEVVPDFENSSKLSGIFPRGVLKYIYSLINPVYNYHQFIQGMVGTKSLRVFDFGCGNGWFLKSLQNSSKLHVVDSAGYDFSKEAAEICARKNISVTTDFSKISGRYDLVVCLHFLEHVKSPQEILARARKILKDDGILLIAVPNTGGLGRKLKGLLWDGYNVPKHLVNYNPKALKHSIESQGFQSWKTKTSGFFPAYPLFRYSILHKVFLLLVGTIGLGDELMMAFRKS